MIFNSFAVDFLVDTEPRAARCYKEARNGLCRKAFTLVAFSGGFLPE